MASVRLIPERLFALDTRSLALFRIGLGLLVFCDAGGRLFDAVALYSDAGAVPRAVVREFMSGEWPLSLQVFHGSAGFAVGLLVLQALAGICLLVGYRTRLATAVAWLLTLSIQHRNPFVANWGDMVLRLLLFWSLFLPLAERAAIDRSRDAPARSFLSFGSVGFIVQLACIYVFSAALKTGDEWRTGSAVATALQNELMAKPIAPIALGYPALLAAMTHTVRYFEAIGPLLLFVPFALGPLRTLIVLAFCGFHLGLFAMLELGMFPFVCIVAWWALLPGGFWDRLGVRGREATDVRRARQAPALVALILIVVSNLGTLPNASIAAPLREPLRWSGLYQRWGMFAPDPRRDQGWLVVVGRRTDGGEEDVLRGGAVSWSRPTRPSELHPSARWRTYLSGLWRRRPEVRRAYAAWVCRNENARRDGDARLESVTLHYLKDVPAAPGEPARVDRIELSREPCERAPS